MLSIKLPPDVDERLTELAGKPECRESMSSGEAILSYLDELEDAVIAIDRLREGGERIPLERLLQEYKLEQVD